MAMKMGFGTETTPLGEGGQTGGTPNLTALDAAFGEYGAAAMGIGDAGTTAADVAVANGKILVASKIDRGFSRGTDFALQEVDDLGTPEYDPGFGCDGTVYTDFAEGDDVPAKILVQSDNKILVAGSAEEAGHAGRSDFALARYLTDGSLDGTFGVGGKVTTDFATSDDVCLDAVIQSDGKIVLVGRSTSELGSQVAVARYNTNGSLDTSFDADGKVLTTLESGADSEATAVVAQQSAIVVAANVTASGHSGVALARYDRADGSLDTTFNSSGILLLPSASNRTAGDLAIEEVQSEEKLVLCGTSRGTGTSANDNLLLIRCNPDGTLDSGFGTGGVATTDVATTVDAQATPCDDQARAIAVQGDQLVIAGHGGDSHGFVLARFDSDGELDSSFGADGIAESSFDPPFPAARATAMVVQDDTLLVAGQTEDAQGHPYCIAMARYDADGVPVAEFGLDGTGLAVPLESTYTGDGAYAEAVEPDGSMLVASAAFHGGTQDFAITRRTANGVLDSAFGNDGVALTDFGGSNDEPHAISLLADGKFLVAGTRTVNGSSECLSEMVFWS